jgi:F-type H+-transporting ATPase subunit b
MQFDWTTFALEVLNFLVLVWILKHFLYRPVLGVLDARQARFAAEKRQSEEMRTEAAALKSQYEARLEEWEREREQSRRQLEDELARIRASAIENLKKRLADDEVKAHARTEALAASRESALKRDASRDAYRAVAAMLTRLASPDLTKRIAHAFSEDLGTLSDDRRAVLRNAARALGDGAPIEVATAHRLGDPEAALVRDSLSQVAGQSLSITFKEAPELIAGVRASVGECLLHANLADELAFFSAETARG